MSFLDRFKDFFKLNQPKKVTCASACGATTDPDATDLSGLKVVELNALAKERGHKGYSTLKKAELIDLLSD